MKKIKIIMIAIFLLMTFMGNSKELLNAVMLQKQSNDTLKIQVQVRTNLANKTYIDELSLKGTLIIYINGKKEKLKESKIDFLAFTDLNGNYRVFVSDKHTGKLKMEGVIFEQMYSGKISWYRDYIMNPSDHTCQSVDYFVNDRSVSLGNNNKKSLLFRTKDRPDLEKRIKKIKTDQDILIILNLYNDDE